MTPRSAPIRFWGREPDKGEVLRWDGIRRALEEAVNYWLVIGTVARPVWGVWVDDGLTLSVGSTMLWKQLGTQGAPASAHLESTWNVVIVEGHATPEHNEDRIRPMLGPYNAKYSWNFELGHTGPMVRLEPHVVLAWRADDSSTPEVSNFPLASGRFTFK